MLYCVCYYLMCLSFYFFFFFFQAEDGIRDLTVTGVQTCALPISGRPEQPRTRTYAEVKRTATGGTRRGRDRSLTSVVERWGVNSTLCVKFPAQTAVQLKIVH